MKKSALKALLLILVVALILPSIFACTQKTGDVNDGSLQKILDAKKFVVGIDGEYPPMSFADEKNEYVGFDVDMAKELCSRLGVALEVKPIDWSKKDEYLNNGTIDCIWSGFVITPARSEAMNLSEPYIKNEVIAVVTGDSNVTVLSELKGKKIGLQSGSATHDALEASELNGSVNVITFASALELFDKLELGEIDAAIADSLNAYYYLLSSEKKFFVLPDCLSESECAIAFRKGDQTLRDKVQQIVGEMKVDGKLGDISKKWFGGDITIVR